MVNLAGNISMVFRWFRIQRCMDINYKWLNLYRIKVDRYESNDKRLVQ